MRRYTDHERVFDTNIDRGELLDLDATRAISPLNNENLIEFQKALLFGNSEYEMYLHSKMRGRRGNVLSLQIDQVSSYVKILERDDIYLKFRFIPLKTIQP